MQISIRRVCLLAAAGVLLPFAVAFAQQPTPPPQPDAVGLDSRLDPALLQKMMGKRAAYIGDVAIAPDGSAVVYASYGKDGQALEVLPLHGGEKHTIANKDCSISDPAFSPDGKTLAVLGDCTPKAPAGQEQPSQPQVGLISLDAASPDFGKTKFIGKLKGNVEGLRWSPDGKQVSVLYVANSTRPSGAVAAQRVPEGVIDQQMVTEVQRLATIDVATGNVAFVTPAELHIYEYDWTADGKSVVYTAAAPPGENNWWVAKLYSQPIGGAPKVLVDPNTVAGGLHGLQIALPRISPDGKQVAFIGGLMSDFGSTGGDIYTVAAQGGAPNDETPDRKASPNWLFWESPTTLLFRELEQSDAVVNTLNVTTGKISGPLFKQPETLQMYGARNGEVAMVRSGVDRAPELWAGKVEHLEQMTHLNADAKPTAGKTVSLEWTNEGFRVQGWLTYPADFDAKAAAGKKYPMIVIVHGGPAAAVTSRWGDGYAGIFSNSGYFVLQPNPRGSFGEGEAFVEANRKDFGYGDLRDILVGMDLVVKTLPVDNGRIGITGGSYGGFMSMFAPTQTQRFKASVALAGISDWLSYYGENSIDQWMIPYFGASVYDDPAVYAKMSAINYIRNEHTPMLIVVGDRDGECPAPQSFEMWHALKDLGVPTELVVYPNEGHGLGNPQHQMDFVAKTLAWFAKYMPAK